MTERKISPRNTPYVQSDSLYHGSFHWLFTISWFIYAAPILIAIRWSAPLTSVAVLENLAVVRPKLSNFSFLTIAQKLVKDSETTMQEYGQC